MPQTSDVQLGFYTGSDPTLNTYPGPIGGTVQIGITIKIGAHETLASGQSNLTLRVREEADATGFTHSDAQNHYDWVVWMGDAGWATPQGNSWVAQSPFTPNDSNAPVFYRLLLPWATNMVQGQNPQLLGHNGQHSLSLVQVNGVAATMLGFEPATGGPAYGRGPAVKYAKVQNLVITGVTTSAGNADYIKFDPASTNAALINPTISFKIQDAGDPQTYNWKVRVRNTEAEDWNDSVLIQGQQTGLGSVKVTLNDGNAFGQQQTGSLNTWGTYTFDITVDKVDAQDNTLNDTQSFRSQQLFLPTWVGTNQDQPGHTFTINADASGAEKGVITYYPRDDSNTNASQIRVELIPPSLGPAVDSYNAPATGRVVNTFHPGVGEPDIVLHTFGASDEQGVFTAMFMGKDGHATDYRDHQAKPTLAKNKKAVRGASGWKPSQVQFMHDATFSKVQAYPDHIYRQGETLYLEVILAPTTPTTTAAPSTLRVQLRSSVTKPNGFLVQLHYVGSNPLPMYRGTAKIGPTTDINKDVIGVQVGQDGISERTSIDNEDYTDDAAFDWGVERGEGRTQADTNRDKEIMPGNIEFLQAAGIESIDFWVISDRVNNVVGDPQNFARVAAKNQADVLYFSGHGWSSSGRLTLKDPPESSGNTLLMTSVDSTQSTRWGSQPSTAQVNTTPINPNTNWSDELQCFIISGCSVLNMPSITQHFGHAQESYYGKLLTEQSRYQANSRDENGRIWADACIAGRSGGGPLKALCGYHDSTQGDHTGYPQMWNKEYSRLLKAAQASGTHTLTGEDYRSLWIAANSNVGVGTPAAAMDASTYSIRYRRSIYGWGNADFNY